MSAIPARQSARILRRRAAVVTAVTALSVAAVVGTQMANQASAAVPTPPVQTPVFQVAKACPVSGGLNVTFTLTQTGAQAGFDLNGNVSSYAPVGYAIYNTDASKYSQPDVYAASIGATISTTVTVPGTYTQGQLVHLFALADDPSASQYDPNSNTVAVTITSCSTGGGGGTGGVVYVAMGDSYSSGEGNPKFDDGTNVSDDMCHRSPQAWPRLLHVTKHLACSGAVIHDLYESPWSGKDSSSQISRLYKAEATAVKAGGHVNVVTVTIGGNDVGFSTIVRTCFFAECVAHPERLSAVVKALKDPTTTLLREIHRAAPQATVVLVGYPRLFPGQQADTVNCGWLTPRERIRVNTLQAELESVQRSAAAAAGARFVSVADVLSGHELCTRDSWVVPIGNGRHTEYMAHPLPAGQNAIATAVGAALNLPVG